MALKLLLGLLFIVWKVTNANEYANHWRTADDAENVQFCSHDGYLDGPNECQCTVDYTGDSCLQRKCRNFGYNGQAFSGSPVDRCICPPGFLGRNCEPIKCITGDQQIYSSLKNERAISLLVSYNIRMNTTWKSNGDLGELICKRTGYWKNFEYNERAYTSSSSQTESDCLNYVKTILDYDPCTDDENKPIECQKLDIKWLNAVVQNSPPNSIVFVATNMNVTSATSDLQEQIIATSIARRIQINVMVYNNTGFFASDPGLAYLNNIATATFGNFILPSLDSKNEQYLILDNLLSKWESGLAVSNAFTSTIQNLPVDNSVDLYIAAQAQDGLTFNTDSPPSIEIQTDNWKLYKLVKESYPKLLSVSGQDGDSTVFVYGGLKTYSAFTSDDLDIFVDAAYSISVAGASYLLVFRMESPTGVIPYSTGIRILNNENPLVTAGQSVYNRSFCQFNLGVTFSCNAVGATFVTTILDNKNSVAFPIYCSSPSYAESIYNNLAADTVNMNQLLYEQTFSRDISCPTEEVAPEAFGNRNFLIICENTKDDNAALSSVDNVFINPNSIFYQLSKFVNSPDYTSSPRYNLFSAQLHSGLTENIQTSPDYGKFLTKVMATTTSAVSHNNNQVDVSNLLKDTIVASNSYSDVLFIVNYNATLGDPTSVKTLLETKRSKLFVIFIQTYMTYDNTIYQSFNKLAISSGGVAIRLNSYDDLQKFFTQYFPLLVTNDVVAKAYSENQRAGVSLQNVYLLNEAYTLLVTNEDLMDDGIMNVTLTVNGITVTPLPQIGELQLFTLLPQTPGMYNIPIYGSSKTSNVVLLTSSKSDFISLSFLDKDNNNRNDVVFGEGRFTPFFYSSEEFAAGSTVSITYSDPSNPASPIYNGNIVNVSADCGFKSFKYTTNYDWVCANSDGLYHFKIDRVATNGMTISRTFPITCLGVSSGSCLNGGTQNEDGSCFCQLQWTGQKCESPRCLNGGVKTTADTCNCTTAFAGDFCEISISNCISPPTKPDYRSELSSLVIVADLQALQNNFVSDGIDITGVPITTILYGDGNDPRIVQITTNGQKLPEVLNNPVTLPTPTPDPTVNDLYKALNIALDNQITDRALYVVLTSNSNVAVDGDFLIRLAAKRAEIRVISSSGTEGTNSLTLSLIGNGIPMSTTENTDFNNYLKNYVAPLFQSMQYQNNVPQRVFNVFQTGTLSGPTTVSISKDSTFGNAMATAFVHVYKGYIPSMTPSASVGDSELYSISFNPKDGKDIPMNIYTLGISGFYSIEVVGYLKTEYGFTSNDTNGANEALKSGATSGISNTITILSVPYKDLYKSNPADFPYLYIREISNNGSLSDSTTVLFSRNNGSICFFRHFAQLDICSNADTIGYQVQLISRTATLENRQQQFVLTCFKTQYANKDTACGGDGSPKETCDCDVGYNGLTCSEPECRNGGVRDVSVCRCPLLYYGRLCDKAFGSLPTKGTSPISLTSTTQILTSSTTTEAPTNPPSTSTLPVPRTRVAAFIIDVIGNNDYAYNQTIRSILAYYNAFTLADGYIMLADNLDGNGAMHFDFQQYSSSDALESSLSRFWSQRTTASKTTNFSKALNNIWTSYQLNQEKFSNPLSMNIFYNAQTPLEQTPDPTILSNLAVFQTSSIFYSPFNQSATQPDLDSLQKFSPNVTNVRDYYSGLVAMVGYTSQNENAILPQKPAYKCVFGLQVNVKVAVDRSKSTVDGIDDMLRTFLTNFRLGFNYIENDEDKCTAPLPSFYNERAALTSFAYYDQYVRGATFCPSQYTSMLSFSVTGSYDVPQFSSKTVKAIGKNINKADCSCSRFTDDKTLKLIIWTPRAPGPVEDDYLSNLKLNTTNAYHFVVPFYDSTDKVKDLYYQILKEQPKGPDYYFLSNAATTNVTEIIDTLYTKICETSSVDPTAIPPMFLQEENRQYFGN